MEHLSTNSHASIHRTLREWCWWTQAIKTGTFLIKKVFFREQETSKGRSIPQVRDTVTMFLCYAVVGQTRKTTLPCEYSRPLLRDSAGAIIQKYADGTR